ncbi:MAG: ParB N-terminal domain-containing protein [Deltaproteobacteria bacterium]|nr:ParB N-terminal domain-containing protein [Deltaproteobacteria bacterium]
MVSVSDIDIIIPFEFSFPQQPEKLIESIKHIGQVSPILIAKIDGGKSIIDGFRRVQILKAHNITPKFYELSNLSLENALRIYIGLNAFNRRFNSIEKIRISNFIVLNKFKIEKELISKAELGNIYQNCQLYDFVESLSYEDKLVVIEKDIPIVLLEKLVRIAKYHKVSRIFSVIKEKRLTHQQIREFISDIYMLSMRGEDVNKLLENLSSLPYGEVREKLKTVKNPVLSEMEKNFEFFAKRFNTLSINPPQNFEGETYSIDASFRSEEDLQSIINELIRLKKEWKDNPILK